MDPPGQSQRLSRITTLWTLVRQAHAGPAGGAADAQRELMQRYCGAAYRYLLGAVRDEEVALELFQEFALRFVRGDFRRAAADRGRFRDYVKAALRHLVTDHHRQRQARPVPLPPDLPAPTSDDEDDFLPSWREELVGRTWEALAAAHPALHAVLLAHAQAPDAPAAELAAALAAGQGRPVTAGNVRVMLHRARARFAELLTAEVARTLGSPTEAELSDELRALGLLKLCGPALGGNIHHGGTEDTEGRNV
jgi:RNA polymerase sigma-70 factor (ECF subfamily)